VRTGSTRIPWIGRTLASPLRWAFDERAACEAAIHGSFTVDPEPTAADGQR
jgi:hypothetical protein